ncbi:MAG: hypothetical protein AB8F94_10520 [Saprospiraceae bacterium]
MKTIIRTSSLICFAFLFLTVAHSISIKIFPTIQSWSSVAIWKKQVNNYEYEKKRKMNSEWKSYIVDKNIKDLEIGKDDWSYPYYVVKHENGFENTMSDIVTPQDTIHIIHNAKCISLLEKEERVFSDTLSKLNICKYRVKDEILGLKLYEESVSNGEGIYLEIKDRKYKVDYKTTYVFPYKNIEWEIIDRKLELNQFLPVMIGSELIGEIDLKVKETIHFDNEKPSTTRTKIFKGKFQVNIEKIHPNYF